MEHTTPPIRPSSPSHVRPHKGSAILIMGILSIVISCLPLGIVAWVMGNAELRDMDRGLVDPSGRSDVNIGRICGIISVCIAGAIFLIWMLFVLGALGLAAAAAGSGP
jgi:hypothetical protein